MPRFFMLPMLVVTKFEKLVPAATGTVKIRSAGLLGVPVDGAAEALVVEAEVEADVVRARSPPT